MRIFFGTIPFRRLVSQRACADIVGEERKKIKIGLPSTNARAAQNYCEFPEIKAKSEEKNAHT